MEIITLASGSSGNCAIVRAGSKEERTTLLLDAGIAMRTARQLALEAECQLSNIDGVLLTHAHSDHCAKVVPLAARAGVPLYAHPDSLHHRSAASEAEIRRRNVKHIAITSNTTIQIGCINVTPILLEHDAHPTHGFVFECDGVRGGFFTDTGTTTALTPDLIGELDLLFLEFNHDSNLLANGPYPWSLKQRVGGDLGHLSNQQAAEVISNCASIRLKQLGLAHLSSKNNTPELALNAAQQALNQRGLPISAQIAPKRGLLSLEVAPSLSRS